MAVILSQIWNDFRIEEHMFACYTIDIAIIFTTKRGIRMGELIRKFTQLNGKIATIILEHKLFGKQKFEAQEVNVFEDGDRLGLVLHGQAKYIHKDRLQSMELRANFVEFADDKLKILIKF